MKLHILTWDQTRTRILANLATVDASIATRLDTMESGWQAVRYSDAYIEARRTGFGEPEAMDSPTPASAKHTSEHLPTDSKVPDYLQ